MFAIITPVLALPIIAALATGSRARKVKDVEEIEKVKEITVLEKLPWKERAISMFWQLDLIGLIMFIGGTGMFLVTITLANNKTKSWADGESLLLYIRTRILIQARACRSPIHRLARCRHSPSRRIRLLRTILRSPPFDSVPTLDQPDRHHLFRYCASPSCRWPNRRRILLYLPTGRRRARKQVGNSTQQHWKLFGNRHGRRCWIRRTIHPQDQIRRHLWLYLSDFGNWFDDPFQDQYQLEG